jgi:hypothetical protein
MIAEMLIRALSGLAACEIVSGIVLVALQTNLSPDLPEAVKSEGTAAVLWLVGIGLAFALAVIRWVVMPVVTAVNAFTASQTELTAKLERDIHEAEEARRHLHALRTGFSNMQALNLRLIEYLEVALRRRMAEERRLMEQATAALDPPTGEVAIKKPT